MQFDIAIGRGSRHIELNHLGLVFIFTAMILLTQYTLGWFKEVNMDLYVT